MSQEAKVGSVTPDARELLARAARKQDLKPIEAVLIWAEHPRLTIAGKEVKDVERLANNFSIDHEIMPEILKLLPGIAWQPVLYNFFFRLHIANL